MSSSTENGRYMSPRYCQRTLRRLRCSHDARAMDRTGMTTLIRPRRISPLTLSSSWRYGEIMHMAMWSDRRCMMRRCYGPPVILWGRLQIMSATIRRRILETSCIIRILENSPIRDRTRLQSRPVERCCSSSYRVSRRCSGLRYRNDEHERQVDDLLRCIAPRCAAALRAHAVYGGRVPNILATHRRDVGSDSAHVEVLDEGIHLRVDSQRPYAGVGYWTAAEGDIHYVHGNKCVSGYACARCRVGSGSVRGRNVAVAGSDVRQLREIEWLR